MTEPGVEKETLRAERDDLREALRHRTAMMRGAISQIHFKQWVRKYPEEMACAIDDRIPPVRWAAGGSPYVRRPPRYESHPSLQRRSDSKGACRMGYTQSVHLLWRQDWESCDIDDLQAELDELRRAVDHQIAMFQEALSNIYLQWRHADGDPR